ncbi:MAG: hypothetical protein WCW31_00235 [Patescibacteria group bacterium]|jgi:hypothetical protein
MQKESWKVFLACAFGAGIGSLVALQLSHWFWWVGLLVGGIVGYLSYEWKAVVQAVPHAFRAAIKARLPRPGFAISFGLGVLTWNFMFWVSILCASEMIFKSLPLSYTSPLFKVLIILPFSISACIFTVMLFVSTVHEDMKDDWPKVRKIAIATFPPVVVFWHIPRALVWFARKLPGAAIAICMSIAWAVGGLARFCKRFAWQMFIRIHSEKRLICGVDAMLGTAIGYMAHHAIIGALAGGIIGLINHAIVTERWLKPHGYITVKS